MALCFARFMLWWWFRIGVACAFQLALLVLVALPQFWFVLDGWWLALLSRHFRPWCFSWALRLRARLRIWIALKGLNVFVLRRLLVGLVKPRRRVFFLSLLGATLGLCCQEKTGKVASPLLQCQAEAEGPAQRTSARS